MEYKGKQLEFISFIKRDGTGTVMVGSKWNKNKDYPKVDDMSYLDDEIFDEEDQERQRKRKKNEVTKTPVLDNFCRDVTKDVEMGKIDKVIGRSVEIKRVATILSRRKKNNPISSASRASLALTPETLLSARPQLSEGAP